ncbi:MAG: YibE/F family protein [Lachnospira eligens]
MVIQNDNEDLQAAADLESGDSQEVVLRIKSGSHKGEEVKAYSLNGYLYGANCKVGTRVIANISEYNGNLSANVYNYDREPEIIALLATFFGLMWLVGGKKGFNSVLALIFTFGCSNDVYSDDVYRCFTIYCSYIISCYNYANNIYSAGRFSEEINWRYAWHNSRVVVSGLIALVFGHFGHVTRI